MTGAIREIQAAKQSKGDRKTIEIDRPLETYAEKYRVGDQQ